MSIEFYARTHNGWLVRPRYTPFQFPGGEWHIRNDDTTEYTEHFAIVRGADVNDLVVAALWADMLPFFSDSYLFLPYLPAARADRGAPLGVAVYQRLVETIDVARIVYIDPHSDIARGTYDHTYTKLDGSTSRHNTMIDHAKVAVRSIAGRSGLSPYVAVIAPDKGAHDRAMAVGDLFGIPTYFAGKERDFETGKLTKFTAPAEFFEWGAEGAESELARNSSDRYLVVDDICDGGGTFMGLASVLGIPRENLDLWVTHGIFSGNAGQLTEAYANVYTTDSHPGARNPAVGAKVTDLLPYFFEEVRHG